MKHFQNKLKHEHFHLHKSRMQGVVHGSEM